MPHFPLGKTRNSIKVAGSHSASFAQLCSVVHVVRAEKGKSISAKGSDSSLTFMLAKHNCFGKVHLMGGGLKDKKVALINLNLLWMSAEAGSSRATEGHVFHQYRDGDGTAMG